MKNKFIIAALAFLISGGNLQAQTIAKTDKVLVVYYSKTGNTKEIATQIHTIGGGDIFEIQPLNAYPEDYKQTTEQAKKEIAEGLKPELKDKIKNINDYQVIFVGSPCWWGTIASPVASFLSEYNLDDKTIIPFMTHGGSGFGHSLADIKKLQPKAKIVEGEAFWGKNVKNQKEDVREWLEELRNE